MIVGVEDQVLMRSQASMTWAASLGERVAGSVINTTMVTRGRRARTLRSLSFNEQKKKVMALCQAKI